MKTFRLAGLLTLVLGLCGCWLHVPDQKAIINNAEHYIEIVDQTVHIRSAYIIAIGPDTLFEFSDKDYVNNRVQLPLIPSPRFSFTDQENFVIDISAYDPEKELTYQFRKWYVNWQDISLDTIPNRKPR